MAWFFYLADDTLANLKGKVALLMYHRVLSKKDLGKYYVQPGMYVLEDVFDQHMSYLKKNFEILSFSDLIDTWETGIWDDNRRYCVITFDDGWLDNYEHAYPVLRKYHIPATIFLPTAFIGTNEWFWPDKLGIILQNCFSRREEKIIQSLYETYPWLKSEKIEGVDDEIDSIIDKVKKRSDEEISRLINDAATLFDVKFPEDRILMNWEEIAEMSGNNISFGSHSANHSILTKLTRDKIEIELKTSLTDLLGKTINSVPVFCYPNGNFNDDIVNLVKEVGYSAGVSTRPGIEGRSPIDRFVLHRIGIHNDISTSIPLYTHRIRKSICNLST